MDINVDIREEFESIIETAYRIAADVGEEVELVLQEGRKRPLDENEAFRLLTKVVTVLRDSASQRGDRAAIKSLESNISEVIGQMIECRQQPTTVSVRSQDRNKHVLLVKYNGIEPGPVKPSPFFHGSEVHVNCGFVKTTDIQLWDRNERLDIHLGQFKQKLGRTPTAEELLDIMMSKMNLPGIEEGDQFKIVQLARSIAINGVRKPPIIDINGTLLDGNRRVTACRYILSSDEFDSDEKRRAEYIFVWQLTEHASDDERHAVVVSLNFEPDCKEDWPEYIKARKVYEEWQAMLSVEPRSPGSQRQREMKHALSRKFALGPTAYTVNRYLKMVDWAEEFEHFHINQKHEDDYKVKHSSNRYFQYFDELSKGANPGGVAHTLNQDEAYKHLVYDLLFQGKFKNWNLIRSLKHYDQDVRDSLSRAREMTDLEEAQDMVEDVLNEAKNRRRESRVGNPNTRIEVFVKWLESLPMNALRNDVRSEQRDRLLDALRLVERVITFDPEKAEVER